MGDSRVPPVLTLPMSPFPALDASVVMLKLMPMLRLLHTTMEVTMVSVILLMVMDMVWAVITVMEPVLPLILVQPHLTPSEVPKVLANRLSQPQQSQSSIIYLIHSDHIK